MKIICPSCKSATTWEENPNRPFCSVRCKLADLAMWASEGYRIAGEQAGESDETPEKTENPHES